MKSLISIFVILLSTTCFAGDFDKTDKKLFASVCILQIIDGLTTVDMLKDKNNYIMDTWSWKYNCKRPSAEHLWGIKTAELIGAYCVGKALPSKWRKVFFIGVDSLLLFCIHHNLKAGAGFSITF